MRRQAAALVAGLVAGHVVVGAVDRNPAAGAKNYAEGGGRAWVQRALESATRRLEVPECQHVFSEFSDAAGVPLSTKLQDLHVKPEEYLVQWMWFLEGSRERQCRERDIAAYTERGSRTVFVCSSRVATDASDGAIVVIHEMLHSLGLGENPPTPRQITKRVLVRCGG